MTTQIEAALAEIEERADAATAGPWTFESRDCDGRDSDFLGHYIVGPPDAYRGQFEKRVDADFIAAARQDIPKLVAALRLCMKYVYYSASHEEITDIAQILSKP